MKATTQLNVGLALSGGGFRASLFNLGSLWRLNELGWLSKLDMVTSVSGGSITAGVLGLHWNDLKFQNGVATNFGELVADPIRRFCAMRIDVVAGLEGLISVFEGIPERITQKYREELFGEATLQDLPKEGEGPRFVIYTTSLQTGSSVRLRQKYLADYKVGLIKEPRVPLAVAVAASSAFPPVLSPVSLETDPASWERVEGAYLYDNEDLRRKMYLTDGGVYDNMGLEGIWDRCRTVLVSDAGAPLSIEASPATAWTGQLKRMLDIVVEQTRALRRRTLVQDFVNGTRHGAYWGITTRIGDYGLADVLTSDSDLTTGLQRVRTRFNPFDPEEQGRLINWGYALADAAIRRHVVQGPVSIGSWPFPNFAL